MEKVTLKIEGMHCEACKNRLENSLNKKENIKSANVDLNKKEATVEFENITKEEIEEYISDIGFESLGE